MKTTITVADDQETQLQKRGAELVQRAQPFAVVKDDVMRDLAAQFLQQTKAARGLVGELYDDAVLQAHRLHKLLVGKRKTLLKPIEDAEATVRLSVADYEQRIERERAADRLRIAEEQQRVEAERRRIVEEALAKARKEAEDVRLAQAAALEADGQAEAAEQVLDTPIQVEPVKVDLPPLPASVPPPPPRTAMKGVNTRENWKFEIVDPMLIPREYLAVDEVKIGKVVRALKSATSIPGVRPYAETGVAVR